MKFCDEMKPLYLKPDVSGVGPTANLLQAREGRSCTRDEAPENCILRLIAFASNSPSAAERRCSYLEREVEKH